MKKVDYNKFLKIMNERNAIQDFHSDFDEDYITEDWRGENQEKVAGYIRYYNNSKIEHIIL